MSTFNKFLKIIFIADRWHVAAHLFIILFLLIGFFIYKDYGVFWDDPSMRDIGLVNLKSVYQYLGIEKFLFFFSEKIPVVPESIRTLKDSLPDNTAKLYGVIFDLPVGFFEYIFFGINGDTQKIYQFRSLIRFLIFILFLYSFYYQSKKLFSSTLAGFITIVLISFSPKIFANIFYNHKDILFMIFVSLGMSTATKLILFPRFQTVLMHSLITSLAIASRPMGIFFLPLTAFALFFLFYLKKGSYLKSIVIYFLYIFFLIIFVIIFSPYLWESPIKNFYQILNYMSQFPYRADSTVLYMGNITHISKLPWHYIPVWILISTPPLVIFLFAIGILFFLLNLLKKKIKNTDVKEFILFCHISVVFVSIFLVIIKNSALHNDWRQMYYIYPSLILIATYGFMFIFENVKKFPYKNFLLFFIIFSFALNQLNWMIKAHPLQNIYFNFFIGSNWKQKFDLDYGGVGNYLMIKNILLIDKRNNISICPISDTPITYTIKIIDKNDRNRIAIQCSQRPDYLLQNYYKIKNYDLNNVNDYIIFDQKKIFSETIITVFKKSN